MEKASEPITQEAPNTPVPEKVEKPEKPKKKRISLKKHLFKIFMVFICLVLLITSTLLGYFYLKERNNTRKLRDEKTTLENEKASLESQNASLTEDLQAAQDASSAEKQELLDSIDQFEENAAKIDQYNAVLDYVYDLLIAHPTLTGFTEAEYQTGRALAVKTGDQDLVDAADNAWNNTDGNPVLRFAQVIKEIVEGIDSNT